MRNEQLTLDVFRLCVSARAPPQLFDVLQCCILRILIRYHCMFVQHLKCIHTENSCRKILIFRPLKLVKATAEMLTNLPSMYSHTNFNFGTPFQRSEFARIHKVNCFDFNCNEHIHSRSFHMTPLWREPTFNFHLTML